MVVIEVKSLFKWVKEQFDCVLEVVEKKKNRAKVFKCYLDAGSWNEPLPGRSIQTVEQDYERKPTSSTSHVYMALNSTHAAKNL